MLQGCDGVECTVLSETAGNAEGGNIYDIGNIIEVIGQVQPDTTILEYNTISLNENFDLSLYKEMIATCINNPRYSALFM